MINRFVGIASLLGAITFGAQAADAQRRLSTPPLSISPYAGYMRFGSLVDGPFNTSLTSANAPVYGAQVNLPLGNVVSIVGNLAYAEPDLQAGIPILGSVSFGKSNVWIYDAGLQLSAPAGIGARTIIPFVQVGAGAMKYDLQVAGFNRNTTNLAFNAGLGADLPLARNIGVRLVARDYIGKFDFNEATAIDYEAKTSHNVALGAGLTLGF